MKSAHAHETKLPLPAIVELLKNEDKISAAYLLGSAAEDRLRMDSDVDIAILEAKGQNFSLPERMGLAADIASLVHRHVDLGLLQTGNLIYAKEAVVRGRLIFERDPAARARFEALVFSMYADLQENRREVTHAYSA